MAEMLNTNEELQQQLMAYARGLDGGNTNRSHYDQYQDSLALAGPQEVNWLVDQLMQDIPDLDRIKSLVAKFIRACGKSLDDHPAPNYPENTLFSQLLIENSQLTLCFQSMTPLIKQWYRSARENLDQCFNPDQITGQIAGQTGELKELITTTLQLLETHYTFLQNEVFPRFEQGPNPFRCVQLMWSIQDDVLHNGKAALDLLDKPQELQTCNETMGKFTLDAKSLIYREEKILFPVMFQMGLLTASETSTEVKADNPGVPDTSDSQAVFHCSTGSLTATQLTALFKALPLDITFIDDTDRVQFFSETPDRIFPRSPGILGRKVEHCHPPKSLDRVIAIVDDLKSGKKDVVRFWLNHRGTMVLIEYRALRDDQGKYLGIMESTQDITDIHELTGEKRLED